MEKIEPPMKDVEQQPNGEAVAPVNEVPVEHRQQLGAVMKGISKNDFTELKGFRFPPREIAKLSELFLLILGEKDPEWKLLNKHVGKFSNDLSELKNFDVSSITPEQKPKIEQAALELNTTVNAMGKKSKAGAGVLSWCFAVMELAGIAPDYNRK